MIKSRTIYFKNFSRFREIGSILIKHGFGFLFDNTSLRKFLPFHKHVIDENLISYTSPQRLRMAFEELGPTFIKLGQLLSVRPDLLDQAYIEELEKLQNDVEPIPFEQVIEVCQQNGIDIYREFLSFERDPIAAASIAQVHRARLLSGEDVVIKIQRPGIEKVILTDLEILLDISRILEKKTSWARFYQLNKVVEELREAILAELNFLTEAENIDTFRRNFQGHKNIHIPRVIKEYTTRQVLVMEYLEGIKISDFETLRKSRLNHRRIAENLVDILYNQIYIHGFFHADPHPGNIAVAEDESIILYDFGQVGHLDNVLKENCLDLLISMVRYDVNGVTRALLRIGEETQHVSREELRRDVSKLQKKYYGMPLGQINIGEAMAEILELFMHYRVRVPAELSLLAKMLMTIEGIISQLDPNISIVEIAEPYGRRAVMQRYKPDRLKSSMENLVFDYSRLLQDLPNSLEALIHLINEGELKIKMEHVNLPRATAKFDIMSNRLSLAIILAGIIVGTALIYDSAQPALFGKFSLAEFGFVTATILGLFLAYSILKSGKY